MVEATDTADIAAKIGAGAGAEAVEEAEVEVQAEVGAGAGAGAGAEAAAEAEAEAEEKAGAEAVKEAEAEAEAVVEAEVGAGAGAEAGAERAIPTLHPPLAPQPGSAIMWFRSDLRLADNPALSHAAQYEAVIPVYIWAPEDEGDMAPRGAAEVWLKESLLALDRSLRAMGSALVLRRATTSAQDELLRLVWETGASAVCLNRRAEPALAARDFRVQARLRRKGTAVHTFAAAHLHEPDRVRLALGWQGGHWGTLTPFRKAVAQLPPPGPPLPAPGRVPTPAAGLPASATLEGLGLAVMPVSRRTGHVVDWGAGIRAAWDFGEEAAQQRLAKFVAEGLLRYERRKGSVGAAESVSRLSPYLRWGELSPRQVCLVAALCRLPCCGGAVCRSPNPRLGGG